MGTISKTLVGDAARHREVFENLAGEFSEGLPESFQSLQHMVGDGEFDSLQLVYLSALNFADQFAETVSENNEFREYRESVENVELRFDPVGPPASSVTRGYFVMWALFDLRFGPDRETIGTCLIDLMQAMNAEPMMIEVLQNLQSSRMGIFEHLGQCEHGVGFRELLTRSEMACHPSFAYRGEAGQLWFVRTCPPFDGLVDYHVAMTSPYVLIDGSVEDWEAVLKNSFDGKDASNTSRWHEFIATAFDHDEDGAIFLSGLPCFAETRNTENA